jgi:hypothetical protein
MQHFFTSQGLKFKVMVPESMLHVKERLHT